MSMYGNNAHAHKWGENSKGCFCLTCGQFEAKEDETSGAVPGGYMQMDCDVLWPDKAPDPAEDIAQGSQKKR